MGGNPAPIPAAAQALRGLDFLVVQDLFLTETAQLADVVLPAHQLRRGRRHLHQPGTPGAARAPGHPGRGREPGRLADPGRAWPAVGRRLRGSQTQPRGRGCRSTAAQADWKRKRKRSQAQRQRPVAKPWNYTSLARSWKRSAGRCRSTAGSAGRPWASAACSGRRARCARVGARAWSPLMCAPVPPLPTAASGWPAARCCGMAATISAAQPPQVLQADPRTLCGSQPGRPGEQQASSRAAQVERHLRSFHASAVTLHPARRSGRPTRHAWVPFGLAGSARRDPWAPAARRTCGT